MKCAPLVLAEPISDKPVRRRDTGSRLLPDSGTRPRPRVLIVDDEKETREMYAWCMRAGGWAVEEVTNGQEALLAAPAFEPDVIVMDLRLPIFSGLEVTRQLKAHVTTSHIPIVACSGIDASHGEALAREAGCDEFVAKPCLPEDLRARLESLICTRGGSSM